MKLFIIAAILALVLFFSPSEALTAGFGQGAFSNLALLQSGSLTQPLIKTVGLALDNRPYEPATPLGVKIGLDIGVEAAIARVPDDFRDALTQAGFSGGSSLTILPVARILVHKGIGERVDLGGSFMGYQGYRILGADLKIALYNPTEGPTWAIRICYSSASLGIIDTKTWTPQLLISRKMDYADPYIGVGYQYVNGSVNLAIPVGPITVPYTSAATATAVTGFLGVGFVFPPLGLKLTLEGTASNQGTNILGTKISFAI